MLYNEYLSEKDSYIIEEKKIRKKVNFKYINFCIITLLMTIISFKGGINPFPYIMVGLASTFSMPLIIIYACSMVGMMIIGGNSILSFALFTLFFIVFSIITAVVNIEGISRKYVNLIKMIISMLIVNLGATIFTSLNIINVFCEALLSGILFIILVTGIYVIFNIKKSYVFSNEEMIAALVLIAIIISNLNGLEIYNISFMNILVIAITMIYGWKSSCIMGAVAGLSLGLVVTTLSDFNISFIIMLSFSGMIAGMFRKFGKLAVIIGFILGTIVISVLLTSYSYFSANIIEIVIASISLLFMPKKFSKNLDNIFSYNMKIETMPNNLLAGSSNDIKSKLKSTAEVFNEIADITLPVTKESKEEIREIILKYILKYLEDNCIEYENKDKFLDKEDIVIYVDNIANKLEKCEEITEDLLPFNSSISKEIIENIKELNSSIKVTRLLKKKEEENSKIMAKQYKEISNIISNISTNINNNSKNTNADIKIIREELKISGFRIYEDELIVDKDNYIEYTFLTDILNDIDKQKDEIVKCLTSLVQKPMHIKLILNISKTEKSKIKVISKSNFEIDSVSFKGIKNKETISGDNYVILNDLKNKYISILSDGVGSSANAGSSSKNITQLLEKLLKGGFKEDKAIEIMNNIVSIREAENNFATLDMCMIDLDNLCAEFVKLGAAPTYIISCSKVCTITTHNVPVGLLEKADYIPITKRLKEGDIIIQVSDGIVHDEDNKIDNYFTDILKKVDNSLSKTDILEYIKKEVFEYKNNVLKDDSTIIIHKVIKSK